MKAGKIPTKGDLRRQRKKQQREAERARRKRLAQEIVELKRLYFKQMGRPMTAAQKNMVYEGLRTMRPNERRRCKKCGGRINGGTICGVCAKRKL